MVTLTVLVLSLLIVASFVDADLCRPNDYIESFYFVLPFSDAQVPITFFVKVGATAYNVTEFQIHNAEFYLCISVQGGAEECNLPVFDEHSVQLNALSDGPISLFARLCSVKDGCICEARVQVQCCQDDQSIDEQQSRKRRAAIASAMTSNHISAAPSHWSCRSSARMASSATIIGIKSAAHHWAERAALRDTWIQSLMSHQDLCAVFIVGDASQSADGEIVMELLQQEQSLYNDVLLQDEIAVTDSYLTLHEKTLQFMLYVHKHSKERLLQQRVMMLDDDVYIISDRFYVWLSTVPATRYYAGEVYNIKQRYIQKPLRNPKHRNYVSYSDYPLEFFPNYAVGNAYLLTGDAVLYICENHHRLRSVGALEDVTIGVWVLPLMLFPHHISGFISISECEGDEVLLVHGLASAEMIRDMHVYASQFSLTLAAACQKTIYDFLNAQKNDSSAVIISDLATPAFSRRIALYLRDLSSSAEVQAALQFLLQTADFDIEVLVENLSGDEKCVQQLFNTGYPVRHISGDNDKSAAVEAYLSSRDVILVPLNHLSVFITKLCDGVIVTASAVCNLASVRWRVAFASNENVSLQHLIASLDKVASAGAKAPLLLGVLPVSIEQVMLGMDKMSKVVSIDDEIHMLSLHLDALVFMGDSTNDNAWSALNVHLTNTNRLQEIQDLITHHMEYVQDVFVGTMDLIISAGASYGTGLVATILNKAFPSLTMQSWPLSRYNELQQDEETAERVIRILVVSVLDDGIDEVSGQEKFCNCTSIEVWPETCQKHVEALIGARQGLFDGVILLNGEPMSIRPLQVKGVPVVIIGTVAAPSSATIHAIHLPLASTAFAEYDMQSPVSLLPMERALRSRSDWQSLLSDKLHAVAYLFFRCDRLERQRMFDILSEVLGEHEVHGLGSCRGLKKNSDQASHLNSRFSSNYLDEAVRTYRPYKFVVAFENCQRDGYVTEKLVNAYLANAVPIYWGAPDVTRYFNNASMINCNEFDSLEKCAEYVHTVNENDELYLSLLSAPPINSIEKWCELYEWHVSAGIHCANHAPRVAMSIRNDFTRNSIGLL